MTTPFSNSRLFSPLSFALATALLGVLAGADAAPRPKVLTVAVEALSRAAPMLGGFAGAGAAAHAATGSDRA